MTREEAKKMLPILVAFAEGKTIQSRCIKGDKSLWYDDEDLSFDDDFEYRIKPEPKYRPFKDAKECWAEMQKHEPFGWIKHKKDGDRSLITNIDKFYNISLDGDDNWSFDKVMKFYTFADGVPFGVKVEE